MNMNEIAVLVTTMLFVVLLFALELCSSDASALSDARRTPRPRSHLSRNAHPAKH